MLLHSTNLLYLLYLEMFGLKDKSELEEVWRRIDVFDIDKGLTPFEQAMVLKRGKNIKLFRIVGVTEGKDVQKILEQNFQILRFAKWISLPTCLMDISGVSFKHFAELKKICLPETLVKNTNVDSLELPNGCLVGESDSIERSIMESRFKLLDEKRGKYCTDANSYAEIFNRMILDENIPISTEMSIFAKKTTYEIVHEFSAAKSDRARYAGRYAPEEFLQQMMLLTVGAIKKEDLMDFTYEKLSECTDYKFDMPREAFLPNINSYVQNAPNAKRNFCGWVKSTASKIVEEAENQLVCYKGVLSNIEVEQKIEEIHSLKNDMLEIDSFPEKTVWGIIKGRERFIKGQRNIAMGRNHAAEQTRMDISNTYSYETDSLSHRLMSDDHFEEIPNLQNELLEMSGVRIVAQSSGKSTFEIDDLDNMNKRNNNRNREAGQRNRITVNNAPLERRHNRSRLGGNEGSTDGDIMLSSQGSSSRHGRGRRV